MNKTNNMNKPIGIKINRMQMVVTLVSTFLIAAGCDNNSTDTSIDSLNSEINAVPASPFQSPSDSDSGFPILPYQQSQIRFSDEEITTENDIDDEILAPLVSQDTEYGVAQQEDCPGIPSDFTREYVVSNYYEFQNAYEVIEPGEAIIIKDGVYDWSGYLSESTQFKRAGKKPLVLDRGGSEENPIYILAESRHGVTFRNTRVNWVFAASHIVVAGIDWSNAAPHFVVAPDNRIACGYFDRGGWAYVLAEYQNADRLEIDNNYFDGARFNAIQLWRCNPEYDFCVKNSKGAHIHHNTFANKAFTGQNGHEAIVLGVGYSPAPGVPVYNEDGENMDAVIENNLFDGWNGESELISIKSSRNRIQNNCVMNAPIANFKIRTGYNNTIVGNWFEGSGTGMEISGKGNLIAFNYVSNNAYSPIRLHIGEQTRTSNIYYKNLYQYIDASDNKIVNNVFNKPEMMVEVLRRFNHTFIADPTGNVLKQNHYYSVKLRGSNDGGSYYNKDRRISESAFRRDNTWKYNAVIDQELPSSHCGNADLFDGPGGSDHVVGGHSALLDSPEKIFAPSWW